MNLAFLVDKGNFDSYCKYVPEGWHVIHMGAGKPDEDALIATQADAILVDPMIPITANVIEHMPQLKIIHSFGVGFNQIDVAAAAKAGVYVCNNAGVNAVAVAEQAVLLILATLRKYHEAEAMTYAARQGEFKGRCFKDGLKELSDCTVGLLGLGAIGQATAKLLAPFGCKLYYNKRHPVANAEELGVEYCTQEELFRKCDIISLHVPVTPETTNIICDETINMMKPGAVVVNTSRGELVDQEAVVRALTDGRLGGFAADTLAPEPVQPDNPIINIPEELRNHVSLSPHIGGITAATFNRSYVKAFANIDAAVNGKRPGDIVNGL